MSRPRKPFGAQHPGRVQATMMKVLAAEMSDPQRLRRGKQYAKDGSVTDIVIEPGVITCEVLGSRPTPYIASIEVTAGDGMPLRRDITTTCTCPDDENWDDHACKHALAAMFAASDEFLLEPELLDLWRGGTPRHAADATADDDASADPDGADPDGGAADDDDPASGDGASGRRHLRLVHGGREGDRSSGDGGNRPGRSGDRDAGGPGGSDDDTPPAVAAPDPLRHVLAIPDSATLPQVPELDLAEHDLPPRRELAAVLQDALAHLRIRWE